MVNFTCDQCGPVYIHRRIREKKAVVNVTGTGDDCFKWAVLAGMHPIVKLARAHINRIVSARMRDMLTSTFLLYVFLYHYLLLVHLLQQTIYLSTYMV